MVNVRSAMDRQSIDEANCRYDEFLRDARISAVHGGRKITFEGWFAQGYQSNPDHQARIPWVISQTEEEIRMLEQGVLEGLSIDLGEKARITGNIRHDSVEFTKKYDNEKVNSNIITYSGVRHKEKGYMGEWKFGSLDCKLTT